MTAEERRPGARAADPRALPLPRLELRPAASLVEYRYEDVVVHDYRHHPAIKAPVAV